MAPESTSDFLVIGGGIVGLTTAYRLTLRYPDAKVAVLEKEPKVAQHQSGRNSGVLHSGIYYKPGSLKAVTCRTGKQAMEQFCREQSIQFENCGKIIVAVDESEISRLNGILQRGRDNGISCELIDAKQIRELEPHSAGVAAIHVRESGIVDYPAVCLRIEKLLKDTGHIVAKSQHVEGIRDRGDRVTVHCREGNWNTKFLITCGGLHSDRLVRMSGMAPPAKIVPFRGEYYELAPASRQLCRNLIYPVPDPDFPFLGVHFTRMTDGSVECGPNAVFALAREGYSWGKVSPRDIFDSASYGGFLKLASRHWRMGLGEIHRSLSKKAFVKALQRLIPSIQSADLKPCRAGVRAQAISPDGSMVDDFLWVVADRMVHVCNAPSPAATASFAIADQIIDRVAEQL